MLVVVCCVFCASRSEAKMSLTRQQIRAAGRRMIRREVRRLLPGAERSTVRAIAADKERDDWRDRNRQAVAHVVGESR